MEYLAQEKTHLTIAINDADQNALPKDEKEFNAKNAANIFNADDDQC